MTPKAKALLLDLLERAGSSAAQQFLVVVLAGGALLSVSGLPWSVALFTAAGAFLVSALTTLSTMRFAVKNYGVDLTLRAVRTFAQSLLSTLGAGVVDVTSVHWVAALNVAAVTTLLSVIKGLASPNAPRSASLLPAATLQALGTVKG